MRVLACFALIVSVLLLPYELSLGVALLYSGAFRAYELVIIGMFIDAQFAGVAPFPFLYTVSYGVIVFMAEYLKPWFVFYNSNRET